MAPDPTIEPETLIDLLDQRRRLTPDRAAFWFQGRPISYHDLWRRLTSFGQRLIRAGFRPGDHLPLALPNGPEFFEAFYGAQWAGGTAVPLYPASGPDRLLAIAEHCRASLLLVADQNQANKLEAAAGVDGPRVLLPELAPGDPLEVEGRPPSADTPSYIQYTSGSTGAPKGVILTHRQLLTNVRQMIEGMKITPEEIFVSWLPVHHDMGLILKTMVPFYLGAQTHLLPTDLRQVRRWFELIESLGATFTAAPDFAYRLALRRWAEGDRPDLSTLRVALNAAEPVRRQTIESFHDAFGLEQVMVAGYGLAEAAVGVSMWPPGRANRVDDRGVVSVGPPFPKVELRIRKLEDRQAPVGEIMVRSPANCSGYLHEPEATAALFDQEGFLHTGDLGSMDDDGNLYVVGRLKNIIKLGGRTLYPAELEEAADGHPAVRFSAAVGVDRGRLEGEQPYLFAEVRRPGGRGEADLKSLVIDLVQRVQDHLGLRPGRVYLLRPGAIPRTLNGKIQHGELKRRYLEGELRDQQLILYPDF